MYERFATTIAIALSCCSLILESCYLCFATGNIGYGKAASQSESWNGLTADLGLDGRGYGTGVENIGHCAHPASTSWIDAYWTVDLGKRHQILNVTIYNREDGK